MQRTHQKGSGSKSYKDPGASSRRRKRERHFARARARKDARVRRSSHGAFDSVEALEAHRLSLSPSPKEAHHATVSR